jgi:hypothetical protein
MAYEDEEDQESVLLQLTKAQRWDLVQEGYNPLDPESVKRWINKLPPDKTLAKSVAKANKIENLGSRKQNDHRDYSTIGGGGNVTEDDDIHQTRKPTREDLNSLINERYSHSGGGNSIDEKVRSRMKNSGHGEEVLGPIKKPRMLEEKRQLITESKEAVNVGYRNGIAYLNAFVAVLKDPSYATRLTLIEQINKLVTTEDGVADDQLKFYRGGIQKAEKEMYIKLKK